MVAGHYPVKHMPCCGLIAFLLAQPMLLWNGAKSWLAGEASLAGAMRTVSRTQLKPLGGLMAAEILALRKERGA